MSAQPKAVASDVHADHHADEHAHPGWQIYARIAVILTVITGVEVATYYVDALHDHCTTIGRDPNEILRTHFTLYLLLAPTEREAQAKLDRLDPAVSTSPGTRRSGKSAMLDGTPERAINYYRAMQEIGIQYFIVQLDGTDLETITLLAEAVAPHIRD